MKNKTKHRLRIVYEKLDFAFKEPENNVLNPYYDGLVNFDIYLDPNLLNRIQLSNWGDKEDVKVWKKHLNEQGQSIKKIIEEFLKIDDRMYSYYVGIDNVSLYLSFNTKKDFNQWNRNRIIDNIL